VKALNFTDK